MDDVEEALMFIHGVYVKMFILIVICSFNETLKVNPRRWALSLVLNIVEITTFIEK